MTGLERAARRAITLNTMVFLLAWVSAGALATAAYGVWRSHAIQVQLCNTISAGRRPDAGLVTREEDPKAINVRQELRDLWAFVGQPAHAAGIPNASLIDCRTGKPIEPKESTP